MTIRRLATLAILGLIVTSVPASAQYGYGGHYISPPSPSDSSSGSAGPLPTPTPEIQGQLWLSAHCLTDCRSLPPGGDATIEVTLRVPGNSSGTYDLSSMTLAAGAGNLSPSRGSLSTSGTWIVRLHAGTDAGNFPLLFIAEDRSGKFSVDSAMVSVEVVTGEPIIIGSGISFKATPFTRETELQHRSWWRKITMRNWVNPRWFEFLCEDLYKDSNWQRTISRAVRIDRDRLNLTHRMPPKEEFRSYTQIEPIMSRYWADFGISLSTVTANRIGDKFVHWRGNPQLVAEIEGGVIKALRIERPIRSVKIGNVLNGIGAAMILLDFWSNMVAAETPAEATDAWNKAGYASVDLYVANVIGNTFGAAAALPGMWVSYLLTNSYDTLIGGYKSCWFKRMVIQAIDADLLSEDINDTRAVNRVKQAMTSQRGLKRTLEDWWGAEAPTWAGKMGGCGNWDLAEARGYKEAFVKRLLATTEVEIDGKRYHPWSFYYSVSRMLVLDRRREIARQTAEDLRTLEAAYISSLKAERYRGTFRVVSSATTNNPMRKITVCPTDWEGTGCVRTDQDGWFTLSVGGHDFSPDNTILLTATAHDTGYLFVVPKFAFEEVSP